MTPLVRCRGVACRLGDHWVLRGADLDVAGGESVALLGRSGSGKTTLLRVLAGLDVPQRGEVLLAGEAASGQGRVVVPPHRRRMAMLFQDLALWPNLTVEENVRLGLSRLGLSRAARRKRVGDALALCRIAALAGRRPGSLSGGQQQRVALARALAVQPKLLLLDEPFGGLDLVTKEAILGDIRKLKSELGFAVILVTHDPMEVKELCTSLAVLEGGRIVEHAGLEAITTDPQSELGKAFVRALGARG